MDRGEQRDAHVAAARREFGWSAACLLAAIGSSAALTSGPPAWGTGRGSGIQICAAVLLLVSVHGVRREWRRLGSHRAALLAWYVETSSGGAPVPGQSEVGGERLVATARAALRTHAFVVITCTSLLAVTASAVIWTAATDIGPWPLGLWFLGPALAGLLGLWSRFAVHRVESASSCHRLDRTSEQAGVLLFVVALLACSLWALTLRTVRLEAEPSRLATVTVTDCVGKDPRCTGRWELDGQVHTDIVPLRHMEEGDVLQLRVPASRPDVLLPQPPRSPAERYGLPALGSLAVVAAAVWWLKCTRALRRELRRIAARTDG
jgi:hypothetical protein